MNPETPARLISACIAGFVITLIWHVSVRFHDATSPSTKVTLQDLAASIDRLEHEIRKLDKPTTAEMAKVVKAASEVEMPPEHGFDKWMVDTLEMRPDYDQVPDPETPPGWVYDGDGPRPVDLPPRIGHREFDGGPDFGNGSWAMKDEDGTWRRFGG